MNVIVVGCGRVGSQLSGLLAKAGHNVTVIDKDARAFQRLGSGFNGVRLVGVGFDEDTLIEAGVAECDVVAAVTNLDSTNLMTAEVARKIFEVPHVIARLYNPERASTYTQLGLDYVCGTALVAEGLKAKILSGHGHHVETFGDIEIVDFVLADQFDGFEVRRLESEHRVRIIGVARGASSTIPQPENVLHAGDVVLAAVELEALPRIRRYMKE